MKTKIKHFDTFVWAWWFSLALKESIWEENIETIGFSEIDKFAIKTYENRFPGVPNLWSISEIDIDKLPDFDLLTGGFPCQDVSVAGKQSLEWWRTVLVEYLLQILEKKQPKYFVFENVKGLMSKKFTEFRESIFDRIEEAWYWFSYKVLNTKDFGLPQNRERVFIVWELARSTWHFQFPQGKELTTFLKDILEEEVDEKYYLSQKSWEWLQKYESNARLYQDIAPTLNTMQWWHRQPKIQVEIPAKFWKTVYNIEWISPTVRHNNWDVIRIKNATKKWYIEAKEWDWIILDNPNSKTKRWRVKDWVSWTLTCAWSDWVITKDLWIRKLTPIECCRLQWFPDDWNKEVSNFQRYKQMWNAISVPVVKAIFDNLLLW